MTDKVISETPEVKPAPIDVIDPKSPGEVNEESTASRRESIETEVITENNTFPDVVTEEEPKPEVKEEVKEPEVKEPEKSFEDKVKEKVQKRIDKEVAKRKTLEEELAETRAELEKLKTHIKPEAKTEADSKREPTDAEVRAALKKAIEDGDVEFQVQITEYMADRKAKAERAAALKEVEESQKKQTEEAQRLQADWNSLVMDYIVYDDKGNIDNSHELNLNNQNGQLYKTALALFNDKELRATHYNDANKVQAFRRAVGDAYREIHQHGLLKSAPKKVEPISSGEDEESSKTKMRKVASLAEPGSDFAEDTTPVKTLSDTEKVIDEIKSRRKFIEGRARA